MTKNASKHTLALIKAGLSAIPYIGGSIASLVGDYIPTATEKSIERTIEFLRVRVENLGDRIDMNTVNREEFAELFKSCYLSIIRSHRDDKLKAATAILANLLLQEDDPEKLSYTELDHMSRCVETLSSGAVEVIGTVVNAGNWEGNEDQSYSITFGELHGRFPEYSPDLLMALVAELHRVNLLHLSDAPMIITADYGNYPVRLTPLGLRFSKFLLE